MSLFARNRKLEAAAADAPVESDDDDRDPAVLQAEIEEIERRAEMKKASQDGKPVTRADLDAHAVAILSIANSTRDQLSRPLDLLYKIASSPTLYGFSKAQATAMQRLCTQMSAIEHSVAADEQFNGAGRRAAAYEERRRRPPRI